MDWDLLPEKEKYRYFADLLTKMEESTEFKGELIEDNSELQKQKDDDIWKLKNVISDELKKDGILKKIVYDRLFIRLP